eukprot:TRINITY_DN1034_c0_g2_i10.p1 TRINITY_DN1034_c0_g2~~TRINITY_DN1034_c0_g2_i10.p1  ORF type:complete len:125 (+),score=24.26 TRINITY_DN1034_c0_g2_i10:741-1115(+)
MIWVIQLLHIFRFYKLHHSHLHNLELRNQKGNSRRFLLCRVCRNHPCNKSHNHRGNCKVIHLLHIFRFHKLHHSLLYNFELLCSTPKTLAQFRLITSKASLWPKNKQKERKTKQKEATILVPIP